MDLKELIKSPENSCGGDKKKPNMIIVWIIIAAVAILAISGFWGDDENEKKPVREVKDAAGFAIEQEERLEKILEMINGAGNVSVFMSIEDGGEKVLARDTAHKLTEDSSNSARGEESESHVVMSGNSGGEPYIVEERQPEIAGILVVAEGAANEKVRQEIYDAVRAVYGVAPHRIKVTY